MNYALFRRLACLASAVNANRSCRLLTLVLLIPAAARAQDTGHAGETAYPADDAAFLEWQEDGSLPGYARGSAAATISGTGTGAAHKVAFDVEVGDTYTVYMEALNTTGVPVVRLLNAAAAVVASHTGAAGAYARIQNYEAPTPGTYTLEFYFNNAPGDFRALVVRARDLQLEAEPNDIVDNATVLVFEGAVTTANHRWAGMLDSYDGADTYDLGILGSGTTLLANLQLPASSSLTTAGPRLSLWLDGEPAVLTESQTGTLSHVTSSAGNYFLKVDLTGPEDYLVLDGAGWVDMGTPSALQNTGDQTIEFWLRADNTTQRRNPWAKAYAGEGTTTQETDGSISYFYGTGGGNNSPYQTFSNNYKVPQGVWTHYAIVRDLSAPTPYLYWYINGQRWNSAAAAYPLAAASTLSAFIGQGYVSRMVGAMSEVRVWNRALTQSEVQDGMTKSVGELSDTTNLAAAWDFTAASGSTLLDLSPNGANGALSGTAALASTTTANPMTAVQRGWQADYLLSLTITDTEALAVASTSLPESGLATQALLSSFTVAFSKTLKASTALDPANYSLVNSGPDEVLGTGDDIAFTLVPAFDSQETVTLSIGEAPLLPGAYSFTVSSGVTDRMGNSLAEPFVRNFEVEPIGSYVTETYPNDSFGSATWLSPDTGGFAGSFALTTEIAPPVNTVWMLRVADLDSDGVPDLVALRNSPSQLILYKGLGDGTFNAPVTFALASDGICLVVDDLFGNGRNDIAVSCRSGNRVQVFRNTGNPDFALLMELAVDRAVGYRATQLVSADFNGDTWTDLAVAHDNAALVTVLLNDQAGGFTAGTVNTVVGNGQGLAAGDLDGDGAVDLVTSHPAARQAQILRGDGTGAFSPDGTLAASTSNRSPYFLDLGDVDDDGDLDLVMAYDYNDGFDAFAGDGAGGFGPAVKIGFGNYRYNYQVRIIKGAPGAVSHILAGGHSGAIVVRSMPSATGFLLETVDYANFGEVYALDMGDLDGDGRPDLAVGVYGTGALRLALGQSANPLSPDGILGGRLLTGQTRGLILSDEADYFRFSIDSPKRMILAAHTIQPGAYYSRARVRVYGPNQSEIGSFVTGVSGGESQGNYYLGGAGVYYVRMERYDAFSGEYRMRLSLINPADQLEGEGNDSIGGANTLAFAPLTPALPLQDQEARVWGYQPTYDGNGDYFRLPNLGEGAVISLLLEQPAHSPLSPRLRIYNSAGALLLDGAFGVVTHDYTITAPTSAPYYVRVESEPASRGLLSEYALKIGISDTTPPEITADSLPLGSVTGLPNIFSLTFSEDMLAETVNSASNYELRGRGPDGLWNTGDDTLWAVALWSAYTSGFTATLYIPEGPLPPGLYRFTATTDLRDRFGNHMAADYTHEVALEEVAPYLLETEPNDSFPAANLLGTEDSAWSGSFIAGAAVATTADRPWRMVGHDFNNDTLRDVAVIHSSGSLQVFLGDGAGGFSAPAGFALGTSPADVIVGDWNGDTLPDIAVSVYNNGQIRFFTNTGDDSGGPATLFTAGTVFTTADQPYQMAAGEFTGDAHQDLLVANYTGQRVSLLAGDGTGAFTQTNIALTSRPLGLVAGDFTGDGNPDFAVSMYSLHEIQLFAGDGGGGFTLVQQVPSSTSNRNLYFLASGDINGDGYPDIVLAYDYNQQVDYFLGRADGTLDAVRALGLGSWTYQYTVRLVDPGADGYPDLVVNRSDGLQFFSNTGDPATPYAASLWYNVGASYDCTQADFDGDSLPDLLVPLHDSDQLRILSGQTRLLIPADNGEISLGMATGRGYIADGGDNDHYSFHADAGARVQVLGWSLTSDYYSRVRLYIIGPSGQQVLNFVTNVAGGVNQSQFIAGVSGRYTVQVTQYDGYYGEYRFRVSVVNEAIQLESENNSSIGNANTPVLADEGGDKVARVFGSLPPGDSAGDYFKLGNLGAGTSVLLEARLPEAGPLVPILELYNPSNALVASGAAGEKSLLYAVPAGSAGIYTARIRASGGTEDVFSQYVLTLTLADTTPPAITADTLPAEGATITSIFDRFSLSLSEDMKAATVNTQASYDLRASGPDGLFDTEDDDIYTVAMLSTYASGLSASYWVPDGPLQPGTYRFRALTSLQDLAGNSLVEAYQRSWEVAPVAGIPLESRDNDTFETAEPLSLLPDDLFDGSYARTGQTVAAAGSPWAMAMADFNQDTYPDLAVIFYYGNQLRLYPGQAGGTVGAPLEWAIGGNPYDIITGDWNKDGRPDLAVSHWGSDFVSIFLNIDDPAIFQRQDITAGNNQRQIATGDLNGDGHADLVTARENAGAVVLLLGDGTGNFAPSSLAVGGRPSGVAVADFDQDGLDDMAVASRYSTSKLTRFVNLGEAVFEEMDSYTYDRNTFFLTSGDLDGDGWTDLVVTFEYRDGLLVYPGGPGSWGTPVNVPLGRWTYSYKTRVADVDLDGQDDLVTGGQGGEGLTVQFNRSLPGTFAFTSPLTNPLCGNSYDALVMQWPGELPLFVVAAYDQNQLYFFPANTGKPLRADAVHPLMSGAQARGNLGSGTDVDYWEFGAHAGDLLAVTSESPAAEYYSRKRFRVYDARGRELVNWVNTIGGQQHETGGILLQYDGTYFIRVENYDVSPSEYRFQMLLFGGGVQFESENNNSIANADAVPFGHAGAPNEALVAGVLIREDSSGDYLNAGNLGAGSTLVVTPEEIALSALQPRIQILNTAGTVLSETAGETASWTAPAGFEGTVYVRILDDQVNRGLTSAYRMTVEVLDLQSPEVVSTTLPAEPTAAMITGFTLTFNEEMTAATVRDAANYELRRAAVPGLWGSDDTILTVVPPAYTSGLSGAYTVSEVPLYPGEYRLLVDTGLQDRWGNAMAVPFIHEFTVVSVDGYTSEVWPSDNATGATPVEMSGSQPGWITGGGRSLLTNGSESDYWSFSGGSGDHLVVDGLNPVYNTYYSRLRWILTAPDGTQLFNYISGINGGFDPRALDLAQDGTYVLTVSPYDGYSGEYRFRLYKAEDSLQMESEPNDSIATADILVLDAIDENAVGATASGYVRQSTDFEYFDLGTVEPGYSIFLSVRKPQDSPLAPVVAVYRADNTFMQEAAGGRTGDAVAEVRITQSGHYYALVRASGSTSGPFSSYLLDVQIAPTNLVSFPNLVPGAVSVDLPVPLLSGDTIDYTISVSNTGSQDLETGGWTDRVVLSPNAVVGDSDDIVVANQVHASSLASGASYLLTGSARIPDGFAGQLYLGVLADSLNVVNEFLFEGDNTATTEDPFTVTLRDYPDFVVENLTAVAVPESPDWQISWNLANRGTAAAPSPHSQRLLVTRTGTNEVLLNTLIGVETTMDAGATLPFGRVVSATQGGSYRVRVIADALSEVYEFGGLGHLAAEQNTFETSFLIASFYTVQVSASPESGGSVTGGGVFAEGTPVTVTATADTSSLPYFFSRWSEGGGFVSANAGYEFNVTRDRNLVAEFLLPAYPVTAAAQPVGGGSITGTGSYPHGSSVSLLANAAAGYIFNRWTEGGSAVSTANPYSFTATGARSLAAVFDEANPEHVVTIATLPEGVASISGAGTYGNGVTLPINAPASVVEGDTEYVFKRFLLNGTAFSLQPSLSILLTTANPPVMAFVAEYTSRDLKPVVTQAYGSRTSPVPKDVEYRITVVFDRVMNTAVTPVGTLLSDNAPVTAVMPGGGNWISNTSFRFPAVSFGADNGGTYRLQLGAAADTNGRVMDTAEVFSFVADTTAPAAVVPALDTYTETSATLVWPDYTAPPDLQSFRVFLATAPFTSTTGRTAVAAPAGNARQAVLHGLGLDQEYHVAVVAVDTAGNGLAEVTPLAFTMASDIPAQAGLTVGATGPGEAALDWTAYPESNYRGLAGYRVYIGTAPFTTVAGMTPVDDLPKGTRQLVLDGLDRLSVYHIAVVAYNRLGEYLPDVITRTWEDPLSGEISESLTLGPGVVDILHQLTVVSGADLTILPGTTLRFAAGTSLTIEDGRLLANGTVMEPVLLTSMKDDALTGPPAPGDWGAVALLDTSRASQLDNVAIRFGEGLVLDGRTPVLGVLAVLHNLGSGMTIRSGSQLLADSLFIDGNNTGITVMAGAEAAVSNSVIKNNPVQAAVDPLAVNSFNSNWWGTTDPAAIAAGWNGPVNGDPPLDGEPVLTAGVATASGNAVTGTRTINLLVSSLNALSCRLSEDSTFTGVLFTELPVDAWTGSVFRTQATGVPFELSPGAGVKTVFAQFRSLTGELSETVSVDVEYVTAGPVITAFNMSEGMEIQRPYRIQATATAVLGMQTLRFLVDGADALSTGGGSLDATWDMRALAPGIHRVQLVATDSAGNTATRAYNVVVTPRPPAQPVITQPANGALFNVTPVSVAGTAEAGISLRVSRNGVNLGSATASPAGTFAFPNVALVEGPNRLVVTAADSLGDTPSQGVDVNLDTVAPAPLILEPPTFDPARGLQLLWRYPETGKRATTFRVVWHTAPFTLLAQATGQSTVLTNMQYFLKGVTDGTYWIGVVGYDAAGNVGGLSNLIEYTYDGTVPVLTIAYDRAMPAGPGALGITVTSNEPLLGTPALSIQPHSLPAPISVPLVQESPQQFTASYPVSDLSARSGTAVVRMSARDLRGNTFNGAPQGQALVFDVTRPTGQVTVSKPAPVQTSLPVELAVGLTLTKPPVTGTTPVLRFSPPLGDVINIPLTGAAEFWSGTLNLGPAQGDGFGSFLMEVTDAAGNSGTTITSGLQLELYTGDLPTPPGRPAGLSAETLPGGQIRIRWIATSLAESYSIYRVPGMADDPPTALLVDGIASPEYVDTPPEDGIYSYVITASRRGAQGLPSGILPALSDRTPPGTPADVAAELLNRGVSVTWTAPEGEIPARYKVYRNGALIRTVQTAGGITDAPPRGLMTYTVAAVDPYGNEALSAGAALELYVDAVSNLTATVSPGTGPTLTWTNSDPGAVGYFVNRDGVRLNTTPVAQTFYTDATPPSGSAVEYSVRAANSEGRESAARSVSVHPFAMDVTINPDESGTASDPVSYYFDRYDLHLANAADNAPLAVNQVKAERTQSGADPVSQTWAVNWSIAAGDSQENPLVLPATQLRGSSQNLRIRAYDGPDAGGSTVVYQTNVTVPGSVMPNGMVTLAVGQAPLAGGLSDFTASFHNRGHAAMDIVFSRANGAEPGDIYLSVRDENGLEVNRHYSTGLATGLIFRPNGDGILRIEPGQSATVPLDDVLVPEALGESGFANFMVSSGPVYNATGSANQQQAGPLTGETSSNLTQTAYFGTSQTDRQVFANDDEVVLTGQAVDRDTLQPVPGVPLKIGIASGGFRWFDEVTTDENGDYSYTYTPVIGFSGKLDLWACHPDIFDTLDQTHVSYYRMYISPGQADIVASRSDTLDFTLQVINPGDIELSGFTLETNAYTLDGETEVPTDTVTLGFLGDPPPRLRARERASFRFRLQTTLDAPDDPVVEFVLHTAEGASADFRGRISLRPAVPILSVIDPPNGYVDLSVNRGELVSREVTVKNLGLRPLEGVEIVPPAGLDWFDVNLARDGEGRILWPDIPVGGTRTFTVVFTPPEETELGYYDDFLLIKGSNAVSDFRLNLFAKVTSSQSGAVGFYVDNILVDPVPNASIRLRNPVLRQEVGPFLTDATGRVTVDGLQEGEWSYQIIAAGHSTGTGTIEVIPDQTVDVVHRLYRSLVTVNFSVVPKPFTDRYEIIIEQTFQTHVPFPVLVLTPPSFEFTNPEPGFETVVIVQARNEGLISLFDGEITGSSAEWGSLTPLITYIPELRAQEVVEIPMRIKFVGRGGAGGGAGIEDVATPSGWGSNFGNCLSTVLIPNSLSPDVLLGLAAIMNAAAECADGWMAAAAASVMVGFDIFSAVSTLANPFAVLATLIGCAIGSFYSGGSSGSGGGGGGGGGGGYGFYGDGCFPEYALVELVDGTQLPISEVQAGMWVLTGNSELEKALVTEHVSLMSDHLLRFRLASLADPAVTRDFVVTGEHRVWTHATGWEAAVNLQPGDILVGRDGARFRIESRGREEGSFKVYTLELDNANAMYVDGILVQDLCGGMHLTPDDWKTTEVSPQP